MRRGEKGCYESVNKIGRLCGIGACALLLGLAGCGGPAAAGGGTGSTDKAPSSGQNANQVYIVPGEAVPNSVTIQHSNTVEFTIRFGNPDETLCLGTDQHCANEPNGPSALNYPPGLQVRAGTSVNVTFDTAGTYHVTSLSYSGVNITVVVK